MKSTTLLCLVTVLALSGCSTTPTRVSSGPIKASTFSFVKTSKKKPEYADNRKAVHEAIQAAIARNLEAKGLNPVASGGDITVAYLVIVGDNVTTQAINDYFGYSRDAAELADLAHEALAVKNKNPNYIEVGTLLVDLIDSKSHEVLFRNYAYRELLQDLPEDVRADRLQEVVDEILAGMRISK